MQLLSNHCIICISTSPLQRNKQFFKYHIVSVFIILQHILSSEHFWQLPKMCVPWLIVKTYQVHICLTHELWKIISNFFKARFEIWIKQGQDTGKPINIAEQSMRSRTKQRKWSDQSCLTLICSPISNVVTLKWGKIWM